MKPGHLILAIMMQGAHAIWPNAATSPRRSAG